MKTKKRNKLLLKIGIACTAFLAFLTCLVTPTFAYTENADGNLVSSNLFDITSYSNISENANISNDTITFNYADNTNVGQFIIQALDSNQSYITNVVPLQVSLGQYSYTFTKESNWSYFSFKRNGNLQDYSIIYPINLNNGTYTFSFSVDSLGPGRNTIVSKIMLNSGSTALPYETFGETWYSQNYININSSILNISNLKQATIYYTTSTDLYHFTFVKNGIFGYEENDTWNLNLNDFKITTANQTLYKEKIYSPYGCFYNTPWTIYQFIMEESSSPGFRDDSISYLEYEFVTPVDIYNAYFTNVNFDNIQFYNSSGAILQTSNNSPFLVNLSGVSKIRCYSSNSDYADEPYYLVANTPSANYNTGYQEGYNSRNEEIENLNDELDAKQIVIDHLNNENNILTQQLNNLNGSWQSVFFSMVDIPFLTASKALGFELFGLNLYRAFIGILTVLAIFFVFRKISGK